MIQNQELIRSMIIDNNNQKKKVKKSHIEDFSCLQEIDSKSKVDSIIMKNKNGMASFHINYLISSGKLDN